MIVVQLFNAQTKRSAIIKMMTLQQNPYYVLSGLPLNSPSKMLYNVFHIKNVKIYDWMPANVAFHFISAQLNSPLIMSHAF